MTAGRAKRRILADCVWRDFETIDLDGIWQSPGFEEPCISITSRGLLSNTEEPRRLDAKDKIGWDSWKSDDIPIIQHDQAKLENSFSLFMIPRRKPKSTNLDRKALSAVPVPEDDFRDILKYLHVPDVFLNLLVRPRAAFKHLKCQISGQLAQVFILCIDSILRNHTAICITYFPKSQQVFGLYVGYTTGGDGCISDVADMVSRLTENGDFLNNPFSLISAFLEIERKHRYIHVNDMVDECHKRLQPSTDSESPEDMQERHNTSHNYNSRLGTLRMHLSVWSRQLQKLLLSCEQLPKLKPKSTDGLILDPRNYVTEVLETCEEHIIRCDSILQVMSLAFQKELADAARLDTGVAISDARQMKAIALLTMFFLPTTAVAGFMDAPIYDWKNNGKYWFWPMTVIVTGSVLLIYFWWVRARGRLRINRRNKGKNDSAV